MSIRIERRDTVITLLRTLRDAGETLQRGDEGGKINYDSRLLQMPAAYKHGSYAELLDCLDRLRAMGPRHYWHVSARYVRSERLTRNLVNRAGRYFEAEAHTSFDANLEPSTRYTPTVPLGQELVPGETKSRLRVHAEVLHAVAQPRIAVVRKPGDPRMVVVRAVVEEWDRRVEQRPLKTGIDFLCAFMPRRIEIPKEVAAAA